MTLRRFMVLLKGLPYDSAWARFIDDDEQYSLANRNIHNIRV